MWRWWKCEAGKGKGDESNVCTRKRTRKWKEWVGALLQHFASWLLDTFGQMCCQLFLSLLLFYTDWSAFDIALIRQTWWCSSEVHNPPKKINRTTSLTASFRNQPLTLKQFRHFFYRWGHNLTENGGNRNIGRHLSIVMLDKWCQPCSVVCPGLKWKWLTIHSRKVQTSSQVRTAYIAFKR